MIVSWKNDCFRNLEVMVHNAQLRTLSGHRGSFWQTREQDHRQACNRSVIYYPYILQFFFKRETGCRMQAFINVYPMHLANCLFSSF